MFRKLLIPLIICLPAVLQAQQPAHLVTVPLRDTALFRLTPIDTAHVLPKDFLRPGSERIVLDSSHVLQRDSDYVIQYRQGVVRFATKLLSTVLADSAIHRVVVTYETLPFSFQPQYFLHQFAPLKDTSAFSVRKVEGPATRFSAEDIFGPGLQKSGSIFRGLTVGSNQDLTLNSGFRMQLSGNLTSDLGIVAALTDQNVPIQPEGTTQTLQELDNVFIQLKSPRYSATLGDFVYEVGQRDGGEFGRISRKLQGARGDAAFQNVLGMGSSLDLSLTAATARGKFTTNEIPGIEGNQGPYHLNGQDPTGRPIIIAGTERVYLNGQLMTRGETNDYTIDYSAGDIYFSAKRLITSASRITVDFEYSDREFTRNLVGASARITAMDRKLSVSTSVIQEADDPSSPIDVALTDSLRAIIASSGTDRLKASVSSIQYVGRDSITSAPKGQYLLKDTLIVATRHALLVYAPGDQQALYSVTFSFIDQMPPDSLGYSRLNSGGFGVAGLGKGNYLPVQFLPIPELHRVVSGLVSYAPGPDFAVSGEYALSSYDRNRLSMVGGSSSDGGAYKVQATYHPKDLTIAGAHLGELALNLSDRFVDRRFVSIDRSNEIEFNRNWNLTSAQVGDEEIREAGVSYAPIKALRLGGSYGFLERTGAVRSTRSSVDAALADSAAPKVEYSSELIQTVNLQAPDESSWLRQRGVISYNVFHLEPSVRIESEDRREHLPSSDSLYAGSFRFLEVAPRIELISTGPVGASAEVQMRTEDSAFSGGLIRVFRSLTQMYDARLSDWNSLSSTISLALRRSDRTDQFASSTGGETSTKLVRTEVRYSPWRRALDTDILYQFSQEQSSTMRRVFVRVPIGTGNYRYKGDLNGNGVADDNEYEETRFDGDFIAIYVPGDQLVPVLDLKTGLRVRFSPARLFSQNQTAAEKILSLFSTETVARIEEKSTEEDARQIYFLHLSKFLNDSTTITGTNLFTQDLYLQEGNPDFSMRFRLNQRKGLLRLVGESERSYLRERAVRMRVQLVKEIGSQIDFTNKIDLLIPTGYTPSERDLVSNELKTEFSYRPYPEWEVAFGVNVSQITSRFVGSNAVADLNDQFIRLTYSIQSLGQLRSEIQREEVAVAGQSTSTPASYPFEFTNGEVVGKTFLWQLAFDYRISQYIQVSVNYDGRTEGAHSAVHTARAEARAFF